MTKLAGGGETVAINGHIATLENGLRGSLDTLASAAATR